MTTRSATPQTTRQGEQPEARVPPAADRDGADGSGVPASSWGALEDGGFAAKLGSGLRLSAEQLANGQVDLSQLPQPMPGLSFKTARLRGRRNPELEVKADINVPNLDEGELTVRIRPDGTIRITGGARKELALPSLGNPVFELAITEEGALDGSVTVDGADLLAGRAPRGFTATGSGTLRITDGKVSGNGSATLTYTGLGTGTVNFNFTETGDLSADGTFAVTPPFMEEVSGEVGVDEAQNITATINMGVGEMATSVPGLTLVGGNLQVNYNNGLQDATLSNFSASYAGFGQVTIASATLDRNKNFNGTGLFGLSIMGVAEVEGNVRLNNGAVTGSVTLRDENMPDGLPINSGEITATLGENNALSFSGTLGVDLGPAGEGTISASYNDAGDFHLGGDFSLSIPGLNEVQARVDYTNGDLSGEVQVPINTAILHGLDGTVTVRYEQGLWSGETELQYSADNGKLSGTLRITVAQSEEGNLELGGGGSVTAQLMPRLQGTLTAEILPEGGVDISGSIEVTEPLELFPERRMERELFRYSQNIPLWAILVAVIRIRAGVRAGVGPGVFRNIRVEGSYTIGQDEAEPSFSISGEMFIPAFVEGYVAFGAGLGLDVVLGSLTGGIEGVATAGLYGAISVIPELNYEDGEWGIEGTATMAAGARLKVGLNAWAEIEALWVTVWEREWELASHTMSIGPDLGLQARMSYKFGQPNPPEIEMNSSDVDTESLIQDAMPEDGPAPSGAREALENRAEWQGALREQREAAVPPEQAAQAQEAETPPQPAQQPGGGGGGGGGAPGGQGQAPTPTSGQEPEGNSRDQNNADAASTDTSAQGAVPEDQVPNSGDERYPNPITLQTLEEPPATTPRTKAQEDQDVQAAQRVLELASAEARDTDALDAYFPAIKRRFRLARLGYEGDFERGFKIVGGINPAIDYEPNEPLSGSGLPDAITGNRQTEIVWETETVGGSQVGMKMEASPLGPDHPAGSEPVRGAQQTLMDKLPTDPGQHRGRANRFIRGHLLNHWIGGPGTPRNMFPITGEANAQHNSSIEEAVKNWVNDRRLWVKYTVDVDITGALRRVPGATKMLRGQTADVYAIDARFVAEASVLDMGLNPVSGLTRRVTIHSTYEAPTDVADEQAIDEAVLDQQQARQVDLDHTLELPESSASIPVLPTPIEAALTAALAGGDNRDAISSKLKRFRGFGDGSAAVLWAAYDQVVGKGDDQTVTGFTASQKGTLTRIRTAWGNGLAAELSRP